MISGTRGIKAPPTYIQPKPKTQNPQGGGTPPIGNIYSQVAQEQLAKKPKLH